MLLQPEFVKSPTLFARRHGVDLVDDVFPETSFKKDPDREDSYSDDKTSTDKANIHLVRHGAIRLFMVSDGTGDWIKGIELNPALLLYGDEDHPLAEQDVLLALSMLKTQVAPLLANPLAARHIVPGLITDEEHVAYWRKIESEVLFPDIDLRCLHGVSHPLTGPAEGVSENRIKLGDRGDCVILIESSKWTTVGPDGATEVQGVRVRLSLKGNALLGNFRQSGKTAHIGKVMRLVTLRALDVPRVHEEIMSQLEGCYLPVPPEWPSMGKPMSTAKVIALLSKLLPIPPEELRAMYEAQSNPSPKTRRTLIKDVTAAAACLKAAPVSSLFRPEAYAAQATGSKPLGDVPIDPQIAAAYGPDSSH